MEQAPIAMTYFGSGIWSYTKRNRGAIFLVTVPSTISKSDCLNDPAAFNTPNLSASYLGPLVAPNSTLQQPVVMCTGKRDQRRLQLITYPSGLSTAFSRTSPSFPINTLEFCGVRRSFSNLFTCFFYDLKLYKSTDWSVRNCFIRQIVKNHQFLQIDH